MLFSYPDLGNEKETIRSRWGAPDATGNPIVFLSSMKVSYNKLYRVTKSKKSIHHRAGRSSKPKEEGRTKEIVLSRVL